MHAPVVTKIRTPKGSRTSGTFGESKVIISQKIFTNNRNGTTLEFAEDGAATALNG
jgi:hypothetical protein